MDHRIGKTTVGEMMPPMCSNCSHKKRGEWWCAAFPKGIPKQITGWLWDHRKPIKGDGGILYDPIDQDYLLPDDLGQGELDSSVIC